MNEDLDEKLKQAQEDHKRMQSNYEIAKQKHEQMQSSVDQLKHKYQELELAIEEQKKKLSQYENIHSEIDKTVKASQQQQNKAALAEAAADSVIQGYLQHLKAEEDSEQYWEGAGPSTLEQSEEYEQLTEAIEENKLVLMDLLKRVEAIQKTSKNN